MIRRTSGGNARNGVNLSQALSHTATAAGYRFPSGLSAKASSAVSAASTVGAV